VSSFDGCWCCVFWCPVSVSTFVAGVESHVVDLEAQATRKAQEKQKLTFLMREADGERARLTEENKEQALSCVSSAPLPC
jgi:Fe-S-cluster-containing hydrogenase component 2